MLSVRAICSALPLSFALGTQLAAAVQSLPEIKPSPAVIAYAAERRIPIEGFELATAGDSSRNGDFLTVLFTIQEGPRSRQWLVEFHSAALTEREANTKPDGGLGFLSRFQTTLYTDTEHSFRFGQTPAALVVRTHGPFVSDPSSVPPTLTTTRVLATREYLEHGLAPMGEIELRLRTAGKQNPGLSYMFRPKYSDKQIADSKARAAAAGFTEEDERAYAMGIFALTQFGSLGFLTEGVDDITHEMADSPTLFSGAFTNPDWNHLQVEEGAAWGLPGVQLYRVPFNFFSKTKAKGVFYFTSPRPPLQNIAGMVGLTVEETSKASGKRLVMRVVASRRADVR